MGPDLIRIMAAVFDVERDTSGWISGMLQHLHPWLADGLGLFGFTYSISEADRLIPGVVATLDCPTGLSDGLPTAASQIEPDNVRRWYRSANSGAVNQCLGWRTSDAAELARQDGVEDVWTINGRNGGNRGCALFANRRPGSALPPSDSQLLGRLAEPLAAAHRLRERLGLADAMERADAVLAPDGNVRHAAGDAKRTDSLEVLKAGVQSMDRARCSRRKSAPDSALGSWKGFVVARWTLLDHFDRDGRRYILAQENEPSSSCNAALSAREREVLANAALGHSNKEIAHALGIAHSTVRVLLVRAARKLDAPSRAELIRRFAQQYAIEGAKPEVHAVKR